MFFTSALGVVTGLYLHAFTQFSHQGSLPQEMDISLYFLCKNQEFFLVSLILAAAPAGSYLALPGTLSSFKCGSSGDF